MNFKIIILLSLIYITEVKGGAWDWIGNRFINYFLRHKSIAGEDDLSNYIIHKMEDHIKDQGASMIKSQVLKGDFMPLMTDDDDEPYTSTIPPKPVDVMVNVDDTYDRRRSFKGKDDPLSKALQKLHTSLQYIVGHYRQVFDREISILMDLTRPDESKQELELQLACNKLKQDCLSADDFGVRCMIDCLTKKNPIVNKYSGHIARILRALCDPIGTRFATVQDAIAQDPQVSSYISAMGVDATNTEQMVTLAKLGGNSLHYLLVTGVATSLLPFGVVSQEIEGLISRSPEQNKVDSNEKSQVSPDMVNPLCAPEILVDETFQMAQLFQRQQSLLDIILPGYNIIATMVKYVPGDHQEYFSGFLEPFEILMNMTCGLISFTERGEISQCNHIGGFPRPGVTLPGALSPSTIPLWMSYCGQSSPIQTPENTPENMPEDTPVEEPNNDDSMPQNEEEEM